LRLDSLFIHLYRSMLSSEAAPIRGANEWPVKLFSKLTIISMNEWKEDEHSL